MKYVDAIEESYQMFIVAWNAGAQAILIAQGAVLSNYIPEIRYAKVEKEADLPRGKFWSRLSNVTLSEEHAAIGNHKFDGVILFTMQVFCPKTDNAASKIGRRLAQLAQDALKGLETPSGGYFTRAVVKELPEEDAWIAFSAEAECNYEDAR